MKILHSINFNNKNYSIWGFNLIMLILCAVWYKMFWEHSKTLEVNMPVIRPAISTSSTVNPRQPPSRFVNNPGISTYPFISNVE